MMLFPDLTQPINEEEWMDVKPLDGRALSRALRFLELTNRRFGGAAAVLRQFSSWATRWKPGQTITILDVGTGGADIPRALVRWARARHYRLEITALDMVPAVARLARTACWSYPEIRVLEEDIRYVHESTKPFDYVMASLYLHHVPTEERVAALQRLDRLTRRGLVVTDLRRSRAAYLAVAALTRIAGDPVTRHDGPLSVRRAFRPKELRVLARQAGLDYAKVRRESFFRVSLAGEKNKE